MEARHNFEIPKPKVRLGERQRVGEADEMCMVVVARREEAREVGERLLHDARELPGEVVEHRELGERDLVDPGLDHADLDCRARVEQPIGHLDRQRRGAIGALLVADDQGLRVQPHEGVLE